MEYNILIDGRKEYTIHASSEEKAIKKWLDENCMDSIEEAKTEFFANSIEAVASYTNMIEKGWI